MNRVTIPFCIECTVNYQITSGTSGKLELYGHRIPMLLHCGHDLCRKCVTFMYKKFKQIICKICCSVTRLEHEDHYNNISVHYYLVGKVLYLSSDKKQNMFREINNLKMTNLPSKPIKKNKKICYKCQKHSDFFCQQCDEAYCKTCFKKIHQEDQIMYQHDVDKLDEDDVFTESKCDQHSKSIDIFCVTCQLHMCSICAIDYHRQHDIQHLEKYNLSLVRHLTVYTSKGNILLEKLKYYKKEFYQKLQKYQNAYSMNKMSNDSSNIRNQIQTIFTSLIGYLQGTEIMFLNLLNQAELTDINSINKIIFQFSNYIDDLQAKLNKVDLLMKNNQHSAPEMTNTIFDIDHMVKKIYYVGKKDNIEPSLLYDNRIYNDIQRCIILKYDVSDSYILTDLPELPQCFTLSATIGVNSIDEMALLKKSTSSISSISTMSSSDFNATIIQHSVKEIKKNYVEPVIVTHINSPSDFYLHLIANDSILTTITNELNKFVRTERSVTYCIERNNVIYAVKCNENQWRRGIVMHIQEDSDTTNYTIQYIDYGSTVILTADRIKGVPETVAFIPPLAYNCALHKLKPSLITGWSNEAYILFSDLMLAKFGSYFVYPMNVDEEQIEVDLVWKEYLYPLSIRDAMFFLGHGSSECYINNDLHEKLLNTITLPEAIKLEEGKEYNVILSHFHKPNDFYLRINDETNTVLINVMELLNSIYKPTEIDTHKSYLLYTPRIGMAVAARYSIDSHWYRAKIISLPEPRMVTVFYIDYGNSETLQWDQLRVLDKQLIEIPPLAIKSMLISIMPSEDGIECTTWSNKACAAFMVLSDKVNPNDSKLSALICEIDSDVHKVVLYNHKSRGEFCINSKLVSQGHATILDPATCLFYKQNSRKPHSIKAPIQMNIRTSKMEKQSSDEDPSIFSRKKVVIKSEHMWEQSNKKFPGIPMTVVKFVSPNEIILKYLNHNITKLTECMNEVYNDQKKTNFKQFEWKINNLCAVFIKKFGNWYRGKILKLNTENKKCSIYFYDINETLEEMPIKNLYVLQKSFVNEKCAYIHCSMDKVVPLGTLNGKWPEYTCDRIIELLMHYSVVYFARKGRKDFMDFGEIWVKDVDTPKALDPICYRWININKYMIEQGLALSIQQLKDDDEHNLTTQLGSELCTTSIISEHDKPVNGWLMHVPITKNNFEAFATFVDYHCLVYLQIIDNNTSEMLKYVSTRLNSLYADSQPEPTNYKWVQGQMVISKYFLDNSWYRGTILKEEPNGNYSVQFLDFGNIESCSHENLRSNLYDMADIPQLCFKGFFSTIKPLTKNEKWPIVALDFIHCLIVEHSCTVTLNFDKSYDTIYAIKLMKNEFQQDICQYIVSSKHAFFDYVHSGYIEFKDFEVTPKINISDESDDIESNHESINESFHPTIDETRQSEEVFCQNFNEDSSSVQYSSYETESDGDRSIHSVENNSGMQNSFYEVETESDGNVSTHSSSYNVENDNINNEVQNSVYEVENDNDLAYVENDNIIHSTSSDCEIKEDDGIQSVNSVEVNENKEQIINYSQFDLKTNKTFEGILCHVTGPTSMILVILKVGGVNIKASKEKLQNMLYEKCPHLPVLDKIIPGTIVVVLYQILWKRGKINNDGKSVYLVDFGVSIELDKKNLRLCPAELLNIPTFSVHCQLVNVQPNKLANAKDIAQQMKNLLENNILKFIGISYSNNVMNIKLCTDKDEIAYQPLIDSRMLFVDRE